MIHPHTELRFINPEMGCGVFATQRIPRGTVTWVRDELDQVFPPERVRSLGPLYFDMLDKYTFRDAEGNHILCWDHARFMNHSCVPSCRGTPFGFEIAVRDLEPGDELTDDYAELNLQPQDRFRCCCGTLACRGIIRPEDAVRLRGTWQEELSRVLPLLARVQQPLERFFHRNGIIVAANSAEKP